MNVKRVLGVGLLLGLVGLLMVAPVFAQGNTPPTPTPGAGSGLGLGRGWGRGFGLGGGFGHFWAVFDAAAEALGLTPEQLFSELRSGKTLEEIAEARGVDIQEVYDAMQAARVQEMKEAIQQAVQDGRITQEQADWLLEGLEKGFFIGPTVVDGVQNHMTLAREEVFGPVLNVMRMDDLDAAIEQANQSAYGNGAAIFTNNGRAAREFTMRVKAGMVGVNVGVPATMAMFPFTGWDDSFYGDLHIQGKESIQFYTRQKVISSRWFGGEVADVWKK